jgi:uncharacterized protein (DUF427 family)
VKSVTKTLGSSPGAVRHPQHRIRISVKPGHWTVTLNGELLADSGAALAVDEAGYPQRTYFPRQDVRTKLLAESESLTTCPFKGEARYYAAEVDGETRDIAWFYPAAYDEVAEIVGYIAFYDDLVTLRQENGRREQTNSP